jgi:hypothetical protein
MLQYIIRPIAILRVASKGAELEGAPSSWFCWTATEPGEKKKKVFFQQRQNEPPVVKVLPQVQEHKGDSLLQ